MKNVIIEVSKTDSVAGKKQRVKVGEVAITVPTIEDVLEFVGSAKVTGEEDGLPVYSDDRANFLQSAILAYVKAGARNKLIPGTATVKDGLKIPTNWEELCAEAERGGNGQALKIYAEAKAAFADWISKQGKSQATQNLLISLFNNKQALIMQAPDMKAKVKPYFEEFANSLDEETLERLQRPIEAVLEGCEATVASADDL